MFTKITFAALAAFLLFSAVSAQAGIRYGDRYSDTPAGRASASNVATAGR